MKTYVSFAAGLLMASSGLQAQMEKTASFQYFTNDTGPGNIKVFAMEQVNGPIVTGKPFSATEEHHTLQVLADGTRIEKTETDRLFRDPQGRTRMERPDGVVIVRDPILGITAETNTNAKNSSRMTVQRRTQTDSAFKENIKVEMAAVIKMAAEQAVQAKSLKPASTAAEESLGAASVNGMVAKGTRQTTTIEAGQIGNDRPIRVVSERWYSEELQMLVKSSNSDPRFGETTYQLTNVSLAAPDPTLFQVPAEHKVGGQ